MKSGKSEALLKVAKTLIESSQTFTAFKPKADTRDKGIVKSRNADFPSVAARGVREAQSIIHIIEENPVKNILIDEIQLFDDEILCVIEYATEAGIQLYAAGLDLDFKGNPFKMGPIDMADLKLEFDDIKELFSDCDVCHMPAQFTQRLKNGKPVGAKSPLIAIEGASAYTYQARCGACHKVPKDGAK